MKTIILSAGRGSRLQGLTAERPKCLLDIAGRSLLEWQVRALGAAGVGEIVVVTGFGAQHVEAALAEMEAEGAAPRTRLRTLHNPFFALADNLASCWIARGEMLGDFAILNGDTLIEPQIAEAVFAGAPDFPITVTIDRKTDYDPDDMKVSLDGARLLAIGKTLAPETVHGESIGFLRFSSEGGRLFAGEVETIMKGEAGLKLWYLSAVDRIARERGGVGVRSIEGGEWGELDFPADLDRNRQMATAWAANGFRSAEDQPVER